MNELRQRPIFGEMDEGGKTSRHNALNFRLRPGALFRKHIYLRVSLLAKARIMKYLSIVEACFAGHRKMRKSHFESDLASCLPLGSLISMPSVNVYGLSPQLFDGGEVARRSIGPTYDSLFRWTGG